MVYSANVIKRHEDISYIRLVRTLGHINLVHFQQELESG